MESLSALEFLLCGCQQGAGRESLTALACKYSQDSGYNKVGSYHVSKVAYSQVLPVD